MKNLYNYLKKHGIRYEQETYGSRYFYNVQPVIFEGAAVVFEYEDTATYYEKARKEQALLKYCKRYGYTVIMSKYAPGWSAVHLVKAQDAERLAIYEKYARASVHACELVLHEKHEGRLAKNADVNQMLRDTMRLYEQQYINELKQGAA